MYPTIGFLSGLLSKRLLETSTDTFLHSNGNSNVCNVLALTDLNLYTPIEFIACLPRVGSRRSNFVNIYTHAHTAKIAGPFAGACVFFDCFFVCPTNTS